MSVLLTQLFKMNFEFIGESVCYFISVVNRVTTYPTCKVEISVIVSFRISFRFIVAFVVEFRRIPIIVL